MPKPPPDYEKIDVDLWRQHASEVPELLKKDDKNLIDRIKTFIHRFGFPVRDVYDKIMSDKMFAANFAKEPRRTGYHEKVAAQWLSDCDMIHSLETLPKGRKDAIYVSKDGEIRENMKNPPSKSLDFKWRTRKFTVYAAHKYTKEGGGTQDNTFKEVKRLLELFQIGGADRRVALLVILDGPYYTEAKFKELRHICRSAPPLSYALPIEDVPLWLEAHCGNSEKEDSK